MLVPAFFALGLVLMFMGDRPAEIPGSRQKPLIGIICVVAVGRGVLLYEWLKSRLRDHGYGF